MSLRALSLSTLLCCSSVFSQEYFHPLSTSHTQFALSLYDAYAKECRSPLFSSYSIATVLSMLYAGAAGETHTQLAKGLHLSMNPQEVAALSASLAEHLSVNCRSAAFFNHTLSLHADFQNTLATHFHTQWLPLNFSEPQEALNTINAWCQEATNAPLLSPEDLHSTSQLVLVNTLKVEASFSHPFNPDLTHPLPFYPTPETSLEIPFMQQIDYLPYYENPLVQMVSLPLQDSSMALVLVLPTHQENILPMLHTHFDEWIEALEPKRIHLQLPKWHHSTHQRLKPLLQQIGITIPFTVYADFSKISSTPLMISEIIHQALFDVHEEGLNASCATAAIMGLTCCRPRPPPLPLCLDRPFLYFLMDLASHEIVFMGRFEG